MTTITIKNSKNISRTEFEDLVDLYSYLDSFFTKEGFSISSEMEEELDRRYEELKSGKVKGIPWDVVKKKYSSRLSF